MADQVRDHIPLEQGLRLILLFFGWIPVIRQRPYSIRTRIKTMARDVSSRNPISGQRPYSIRTRIKTYCRFNPYTVFPFVRDHIPLEQGLRPRVVVLLEVLICCQRPYSIRTRIKTSGIKMLKGVTVVRDHIPLEQGLRPSVPLELTDGASPSETIFH